MGEKKPGPKGGDLAPQVDLVALQEVSGRRTLGAPGCSFTWLQFFPSLDRSTQKQVSVLNGQWPVLNEAKIELLLIFPISRFKAMKFFVKNVSPHLVLVDEQLSAAKHYGLWSPPALPFFGLKPRVTGAGFLLDPSGRVVQTWIGKLTSVAMVLSAVEGKP